MMDVLIAQFTPKTDFSSENVLPVTIVINHASDVLVVKIQPGLIITVRDSQIVSNTHVQIERSILRNNDWVFSGWHASTPPMNNITIFNSDVISVHPVHESLLGVEGNQHFVLFASVMSFDFHLFDAFFLQKLCFVCQAGENDFIATQMNDRIREDIEDFGKYFLDEFVGFIEGNVKRAHEACSESAGYVFVFRSQSPTGSMSWSIKFRNNSHTSSLSVFNNLSCIFGRISLIRRIRSIFSDFRMRVQNQRERVFIDDVPMQNIHFVVHHCIDSLEDQLSWKEMSGGIDHKSTIYEGRFISDIQRKTLEFTHFVSVSWTVNGLEEGLQTSQHAHIGVSSQTRTSLGNLKKIAFSFCSEHAFKFGF